jgi:hypothetical protein
MLGKLNSFFGMSNGRGIERSDILLMVGSGTSSTLSMRRTFLNKLVYMRHRIFLPPKHKYHQWRPCFDGMIENGETPKHRDGKFVIEMVKNINAIFGKPVKGIKRKKSEKPPKDSSFKK